MQEKESELEKTFHELNKHHACVMNMGKFLILSETKNPATDQPEVVFSAVGDIKNKYRNRKIEVQVGKNIKLVNPAVYWLDHPGRREYKGLGFFPDGAPDGYFNFWMGFAFEPKKGSGHRAYLSHVLENICRGGKGHSSNLKTS